MTQSAGAGSSDPVSPYTSSAVPPTIPTAQFISNGPHPDLEPEPATSVVRPQIPGTAQNIVVTQQYGGARQRPQEQPDEVAGPAPILGIFAVAFAVFPIVSVVGIVIGIFAVVQAKDKKLQRGLGWAAIGIGSLWLVLVLMVWVLGLSLLPHLHLHLPTQLPQR